MSDSEMKKALQYRAFFCSGACAAAGATVFEPMFATANKSRNVRFGNEKSPAIQGFFL
jgi:hypothetical protein